MLGYIVYYKRRNKTFLHTLLAVDYAGLCLSAATAFFIFVPCMICDATLFSKRTEEGKDSAMRFVASLLGSHDEDGGAARYCALTAQSMSTEEDTDLQQKGLTLHSQPFSSCGR